MTSSKNDRKKRERKEAGRESCPQRADGRLTGFVGRGDEGEVESCFGFGFLGEVRKETPSFRRAFFSGLPVPSLRWPACGQAAAAPLGLYEVALANWEASD